MPDLRGYVEMDRALDSIVVGIRHRKDAGDLNDLMASIDRLGLLQPVTISPDGVLICGWRRLEAVRRLGWRSMKVWVRPGISTKLELLLAERDENELHKPMNEVEKATLYRELKVLRTEEAARRKQATQFESGTNKISGPVPGTGPGEGGRARVQASTAVTGSASYQTHERVCALMDWAERKATPPEIRAMANDALRKIEEGEPVKPLYAAVREAFEASQLPPPEPETDLARQAREALARVKEAKKQAMKKGREPDAGGNGPRATDRFRSVRSFNLTWNELDGWTEMYDVDLLAIKLTVSEWQRFDRVVTATLAFRDQLIAARRAASTEKP